MVKKKSKPDSLDLWQKVTKTVEPIKSNKISPVALTPNIDEKVSTHKPNKKSIKQLSTSLASISGRNDAIAKKPSPSDLRYDKPSGIDASSSKKLRSGKFEIEATLDLHGMTQANAYRSLQSFIQRSVEKQLRTILVITGKGSEGKGILRNQLPDWLKSDMCSVYILAFGQAQAKDGGSGAFYIRLRRNREKL